VTEPRPPDADALRGAARWCVRLAEALDDVGRRAGALADEISRDWPDDRGREWSERSWLLRGTLDRAAAEATELGAAFARAAAGTGIGPLPGLPTSGGRRPGMRLGDTGASRVDDELGMRIAELPDPG
jgi:hypothetical protein